MMLHEEPHSLKNKQGIKRTIRCTSPVSSVPSGDGAVSALLERHARCYLSYAQANPDDWGWFSQEWPQIERAWRWLTTQAGAPALLVDFACAFL